MKYFYSQCLSGFLSVIIDWGSVVLNLRLSGLVGDSVLWEGHGVTFANWVLLIAALLLINIEGNNNRVVVRDCSIDEHIIRFRRV